MKEMHPLRWTFTVVYLLCVYGAFARSPCAQDEWTPLALLVFMATAVVSAGYDLWVAWRVEGQALDQRRLRVINGTVLLVATGAIVAFYTLRRTPECEEETGNRQPSNSGNVVVSDCGRAARRIEAGTADDLQP
jgi:hypothetical protein